jgi:hypothetical protein
MRCLEWACKNELALGSHLKLALERTFQMFSGLVSDSLLAHGTR